jgi:hypothetical protein
MRCEQLVWRLRRQAELKGAMYQLTGMLFLPDSFEAVTRSHGRHMDGARTVPCANLWTSDIRFCREDVEQHRRRAGIT